MSSENKYTPSPVATRASQREVDEVISRLQQAYEDGRLNDKELGERMSLALSAKTHQDLDILTFDLRPSLARNRDHQAPMVLAKKTLAIFGGIEKKGHFFLPQYYRLYAIMGGLSFDLTHAQFESTETHIHITAIMGGVELFIPRGMRVELHGMPIMGGYSQKTDNQDLPFDAPVIHIHGVAICGGVEVSVKKEHRGLSRYS